MIVTSLASDKQTGRMGGEKRSVGAFVAIETVSLCVVLDAGGVHVTRADEFEWPGPADPWPMSSQWTFVSDTRLGERVHLTGRRGLVAGGWEFVERVFDGDGPECRVALLEMLVEQARDRLVQLIYDYSSGVYSYLQVSSMAGEFLDSSVGVNLEIEGIGTYNVLVELTTLDSDPVDKDGYIRDLLARV